MKITKLELKNIVKECLVEIISEGLGGLKPTLNRPIQHSFKHQLTSSISDNVKRPLSMTSPGLKEAIKREAGGDKILEDILEDTAVATLPLFLQNEGRGAIHASAGGGLAEQVVARTSPEDLFGDDVTSRWTSLAFTKTDIKK